MTKMEHISLPDVDGHILMVGERRGVANFESGNVAAYHTRFICDLNNYLVPCDGYTDLTYMDKSQTIVKYQLTVAVPESKKFPVLKGAGKYVKGTGRFEGVDGDFSFTGFYITPYNEETIGDLLVKVSGSCTLPGK